MSSASGLNQSVSRPFFFIFLLFIFYYLSMTRSQRVAVMSLPMYDTHGIPILY